MENTLTEACREDGVGAAKSVGMFSLARRRREGDPTVWASKKDR